MNKKEQIKKILSQFTPDQRAIAETIAGLKIENKALQESLAKLKSAYDPLYKFMLVLLDAVPGKEYRVHETQFKRFKEEYRITSRYDKETKEMVFELKTLRD
jgi:pyruvate/2-oxoacid:ferredoxin oxidoreductase beta subunit